jgi:phospholipase C
MRSALSVQVVMAVVAAACAGTPAPSASERTTGAAPIDHVVVIYLENRSFDHLYGLFPGAEGLAQAGAAATQIDKDGKPYEMLPAFTGPAANPARPALQLPALPNKPFDLAPFAPMNQPMNASFEVANNFYQAQQAINGGKMDRFVSVAGSLTMGYYYGPTLPMWPYAQQYVLADHFFQAAFGGTAANHYFLFCACTPTWPNAPPELVAQVAADGSLVKDGSVTPDSYLVNNVRDPQLAEKAPLQSLPHIGDRLDGAGVSWTWYSAGWNTTKARNPTRPFLLFENTASGSSGATKHVKDESEFLTDLKVGALPQVAFVKPGENEHPVQSSGLLQGDQHAADLVRAIQESPFWKSTAIIVTYDEGHSFWDHVAPPKVDRWGPGKRVPAIVVSPYAKRGFVDKTVYDTTSILRFIEWRWNLVPLGERDAKANNLLAAFDFTQRP